MAPILVTPGTSFPTMGAPQVTMKASWVPMAPIDVTLKDPQAALGALHRLPNPMLRVPAPVVEVMDRIEVTPEAPATATEPAVTIPDAL